LPVSFDFGSHSFSPLSPFDFLFRALHVGHDPIVAYENEEKASDKHPDFKADGVVVWLNRDGDGRNGGNANRRNGAPRQRQRFADDDYEESSLREPAFSA
jgi:hypothetical protein